MTLHEGPRADRRYPQVYVLPGFRLQWLLEVDADSDCTELVCDLGPRPAVTKYAVAVDDHAALN